MNRKKTILHLALFLLTVYSTSIAGAMFDEYGFTFTALVHLILNPASLKAGFPFSFWLIFILGAHEMGHYLACRKYGVPATLPFFIPGPTLFGTFGAVIRIRGIIPDRNVLFDIGIAGPAAGFLASIPALVLGLSQAAIVHAPLQEGDVLFGDSFLIWILEKFIFSESGPDLVIAVNSVFYAGWAGLLATTMNLFPVGQLDGGHICYAISRKFHRILSIAAIFMMAALVIYSLFEHGVSVWLLWLLILIIMGSRHPALLFEEKSLTRKRKLLSLLALIIFLLSFMPNPIYMY